MEPLWVGAVDAGVAVAYVRSSQLVTSDRTRFHWVDAGRSSEDIQQAIHTARQRLGFDPRPIVLGGFSAGGRIALELAFRGEVADVRAAITVGAALPPDPGDLPLRDGVAYGVRAWLIVGEEDRFREANEALHTVLHEAGATCRMTVVPSLGHDPRRICLNGCTQRFRSHSPNLDEVHPHE
jgi:predicted esterase